jgi:hypothetical protein
MTPIARILKTHTDGENSTDYTPVFTDNSGKGRETPLGSIGSYTPSYFGIHNCGTSGQSVTVWTLDQGTSGDGAGVYLPAGDTFYTRIAKVEVDSGKVVTLLGTTNTPGLV